MPLFFPKCRELSDSVTESSPVAWYRSGRGSLAAPRRGRGPPSAVGEAPPPSPGAKCDPVAGRALLWSAAPGTAPALVPEEGGVLRSLTAPCGTQRHRQDEQFTADEKNAAPGSGCAVPAVTGGTGTSRLASEVTEWRKQLGPSVSVTFSPQNRALGRSRPSAPASLRLTTDPVRSLLPRVLQGPAAGSHWSSEKILETVAPLQARTLYLFKLNEPSNCYVPQRSHPVQAGAHGHPVSPLRCGELAAACAVTHSPATQPGCPTWWGGDMPPKTGSRPRGCDKAGSA